MRLGSRYELEQEIGAGGEARVFRARDLLTDEAVAVRIARQPNFRPEAALPAVQHPGWVRLLDRGIDPEQGSFRVFELLSGKTLGALLQEGPMAREAWHDFVAQSLDTVVALHAAGWTHGDLNADNFIHTHDGVWKVLELPFHRFAPPENRSALFGSIYTLAPEQLRGIPADPLADLYALGCLYYYAAAGAYPHAAATVQEIAIDRLRFPAASLEGKAASLAANETRFVMALLERDLLDRPSSVAAARRLLGDTP